MLRANEMEKLFVFPPEDGVDDPDAVQMTFKARLEYSLKSKPLDAKDQLSHDHAGNKLDKLTTSEFESHGINAALGKNLTSLSTFLENYDGSKKKRKQVGLEFAQALAGRAAGDFDVVEQKEGGGISQRG